MVKTINLYSEFVVKIWVIIFKNYWLVNFDVQVKVCIILKGMSAIVIIIFIIYLINKLKIYIILNN